MKNLFLTLSIVCSTVLVFTISSCKKESSVDDSVAAGDASNISTAFNSTSQDADNAMGGNHNLSGKTQGIYFEQLCALTVDSSSVSQGILTINYNGQDCLGKLNRTGTLTVQLLGYPNTHWTDAGATLVLTYNVTVTVLGDNETYLLTGTHYIENVNGGLAWQVMDGISTQDVVRKHTCNNARITFPDGSVRSWSFNRVRTYSNPSGGLNPSITLSGDTTINGISNVGQWGTDRVGDAFYAATPTAITSDAACGFFHPVSGEYLHHVANRTVTILYGYDLTGPHSGSGCAYGYQITYTKGNKSLTVVLPYF